MTNQTFEEKLTKILETLANEVEWSVEPDKLSMAYVDREKESKALSEAKQAIIKLIEEEVIQTDEYREPSLFERGDDDQRKYWQNKLRAKQRELIKEGVSNGSVL